MALLTSPNCSFSASLWPHYSICSGHGQCINDTCICDSGYTGMNDLLPTNGLTCEINEQVVIILWAIQICVSLLLLWLQASYFLVVFRRSRQHLHLTLFGNAKQTPRTPRSPMNASPMHRAAYALHNGKIHPSVNVSNQSPVQLLTSKVYVASTQANDLAAMAVLTLRGAAAPIEGVVSEKEDRKDRHSAAFSQMDVPTAELMCTSSQSSSPVIHDKNIPSPQLMKQTLTSATSDELILPGTASSPFSLSSSPSSPAVINTSFPASPTPEPAERVSSVFSQPNVQGSSIEPDMTASVRSSTVSCSGTHTSPIVVSSSILCCMCCGSGDDIIKYEKRVPKRLIFRKMFGMMCENGGQNYFAFRVALVIYGLFAGLNALVRLIEYPNNPSAVVSVNWEVTSIHWLTYVSHSVLASIAGHALIGTAMKSLTQHGFDGSSGVLTIKGRVVHLPNYEQSRRMISRFKLISRGGAVMKCACLWLPFIPLILPPEYRTLDLYIDISILYHAAIAAWLAGQIVIYRLFAPHALHVIAWVREQSGSNPSKQLLLTHVYERSKRSITSVFYASIFTLCVEVVSAAWQIVRIHASYITAVVLILGTQLLVKVSIERNRILMAEFQEAEKVYSVYSAASQKSKYEDKNKSKTGADETKRPANARTTAEAGRIVYMQLPKISPIASARESVNDSGDLN